MKPQDCCKRGTRLFSSSNKNNRPYLRSVFPVSDNVCVCRQIMLNVRLNIILYCPVYMVNNAVDRSIDFNNHG